jgi:hypothetical protein
MLEENTMVEVVYKENSMLYIQNMTISEYKQKRKVYKEYCQAFQIGFSQFKNTIRTT